MVHEDLIITFGVMLTRKPKSLKNIENKSFENSGIFVGGGGVLKIESLLPVVRSYLHERFQKYLFTTFGVIANSGRQTNKQANEHTKKDNLLVEVTKVATP